MHRYKVYNGPMPTTAAQAKQATGTAIRTMLQLATPSTRQILPFAWGFSIDVGQGGTVELIQTDVAATGLTAHVASGVDPLDPNSPPSLLTLGTGATGFSAGVAPTEGTITATRVLDAVPFQGGGTWQTPYAYQFTPAERKIIAVSKFLRVRATFGTSTNMICWVVYDE
jgi:hypothetical protein